MKPRIETTHIVNPVGTDLRCKVFNWRDGGENKRLYSLYFPDDHTAKQDENPALGEFKTYLNVNATSAYRGRHLIDVPEDKLVSLEDDLPEPEPETDKPDPAAEA